MGLRRTGPVAGKGSSPPPRSSSLRIERGKKEEKGVKGRNYERREDTDKVREDKKYGRML
jgi:hypothetical protein